MHDISNVKVHLRTCSEDVNIVGKLCKRFRKVSMNVGVKFSISLKPFAPSVWCTGLPWNKSVFFSSLSVKTYLIILQYMLL